MNYYLSKIDSISKSHKEEGLEHLLCKDSFQFTRNTSANQYLEVLQILVPPNIIVTQAISEKCEMDWICSPN